MTIAWAAPLKIIVALQDGDEASALRMELETLGYRVKACHKLSETLRWLREWRPDLIVTEEKLSHDDPDAGLRLAESCRLMEHQAHGWQGTKVVLLIPLPDWDRFKRAQRAGAHAVAKGSLEAAIRYVQTIADHLATDRMLGPALVGFHRFRADIPHLTCEGCEWVGAQITYGSSQTDLPHLTPVRAALLNTLLFRRHGQSPTAIVNICGDLSFLRKILRGHVLRESAVKMEITRLRQDITDALGTIGAPYSGEHFLPFARHSTKAYCLAGNRRIIHLREGGKSNIAIISKAKLRQCGTLRQ